jgi:pimeloyl-ACP methyl ester carboxylesterase
MAPHFFTEDMGIAEIARAKVAFETGTLRGKLAKLHGDPDNAFHNWCDPWLLPEFRQWDLADALAHIRVPMLIVQGEDDQYGTVRQIEVAQENATARSSRAAGEHAARALSRVSRSNPAGDRRLRQSAAARSPRRRSRQ